MIRYIGIVAGALMLALVAGSASAQSGAAPAPKPPAPTAAMAAGPTITVETARGTFAFETFPDTAPKTVAHIVALAKKGFYKGQRIHRVVPGFVVQFGDPQTRDMTKKAMWGTGGSGSPIGVAEISPDPDGNGPLLRKHSHDKKGMIAMAHAGDAAKADSQMYVTLAPQPRLDSGYTVFGQITSGMDVVEQIQEGDVIKNVTVK